MKRKMFLFLGVLYSFVFVGCNHEKEGSGKYRIEDGKMIFQAFEESVTFSPDFIVFFSEEDPQLAMRPSGIVDIQYNVPTWQGAINKVNLLSPTERLNAESGDGFDDSILDGEVTDRTADLFAAGDFFYPEIDSINHFDGGFELFFKETDFGKLKAFFRLGNKMPTIDIEFVPNKNGYFSIGYVGAESFSLPEVKEIWQPLIWQEKRFPTQSFLSLAFRAPVPATLVQHSEITYGVVAHPEEFPYSPLPKMDNSRFGVAVRNKEGMAQPMLFAPVLGGTESKMIKGERFGFKMIAYAIKSNLVNAYADIAQNVYGFADYRRNDIASLNTTFENIVDYSLTDYAWFVDSLKGCAYSTDVPGAVKNVSSLHPLQLAMVTDNKEMYDERAYPIIEYMLSRQKFLFSLDPGQKIQSPSRNMWGPIAPISELTSLYNITGRSNSFLIKLAKDEYESFRIRNLDVKEIGKNWKNALAIYKATDDESWLLEAQNMADDYLNNRVYERQQDFNDPHSPGFFFWTGFTNDWIGLIELYEATGDEKYLNAAHDGARHYAMFCWMGPAIPDDSILVNKGGKAPHYWYLAGKGHKQMDADEEYAPAWRLSEVGLTAESSGTSQGHRAIFMANYAPWMLRLGYYTGDQFLQNIAKAAVIGRYRNFPGYHINTERTTVYEKEDYPLKPHKDLGYNSFHYNHILPMASMLFDYLVTDAFVRSEGAINFPSEFIEGYAYLQSKFYGHKPGEFYERKASLWMPENLVRSSSVELNYLSAKSDESLMVAFMNQSDEVIKANISFNNQVLNLDPKKSYDVVVWIDNKKQKLLTMEGGEIEIVVPKKGLTVLEIKDVEIEANFQNQILGEKPSWENGYKEHDVGNARFMILNVGSLDTRAYVYLRDDDSKFKKVELLEKLENGTIISHFDAFFPYEFTLGVPKNVDEITLKIVGTTIEGDTISGDWISLTKK
jgi:hypothetical protein